MVCGDYFLIFSDPFDFVLDGYVLGSVRSVGGVYYVWSPMFIFSLVNRKLFPSRIRFAPLFGPVRFGGGARLLWDLAVFLFASRRFFPVCGLGWITVEGWYGRLDERTSC